MKLVVTGLSYRTAPIELREKFAQNTQNLEKTFTELKKSGAISEACVISTCNRVEFYAAGSADAPTLGRGVRSHILSFSAMLPAELEHHIYHYESMAALKHLFRVASSLDSMVLGEPQILGQVKEAFRAAVKHGGAGPVITRVFQRSFAVAKRVRTDTGIAENAVSMSFAAVELGRHIFTSLEGKQVLVLGAGKMSTLAAKHLKAYGVSQVRVANRSLQAAQALADEIGGLASSLSDLPMLLTQADIVISSTAAPGFVVDRTLMARVVRERRYKPILFIDIAMPRDIDPSVATLDNVFVYDVDDLESVLESNRETRAKEAAEAERIVEEEVASYTRWAKSQQVVPVIKALRAHAMEIADKEAERTIAHVKGADKKVEQSVRAMAQAIVNKMLHPVMTRLKQDGAEGDPQTHVDALCTLFGVNPSAFEEAPAPEGEPEAEGGAQGGDQAGGNVVSIRAKDSGSS